MACQADARRKIGRNFSHHDRGRDDKFFYIHLSYFLVIARSFNKIANFFVSQTFQLSFHVIVCWYDTISFIFFILLTPFFAHPCNESSTENFFSNVEIWQKIERFFHYDKWKEIKFMRIFHFTMLFIMQNKKCYCRPRWYALRGLTVDSVARLKCPWCVFCNLTKTREGKFRFFIYVTSFRTFPIEIIRNADDDILKAEIPCRFY